MRRFDDQLVAFPAADGVAVAVGEEILFLGSLAQEDAANLGVRLVHHEDEVVVLHDLHRVAARAEHRARHAGAQAETAGRLAARIDERVVGVDLRFGLGTQRQRRLRRAALRRRRAGRAIVAPNTGEIRPFRGECCACDAQAEQRRADIEHGSRHGIPRGGYSRFGRSIGAPRSERQRRPQILTVPSRAPRFSRLTPWPCKTARNRSP